MPRRRRRRRFPFQDKELPPPAFFARARDEGPVEPLMQPVAEPETKPSRLGKVKSEAIRLLCAAQAAVRDSQPEGAAAQQSKALELANQMLAAEIQDIAFIQEAVDHILQTAKDSHFSCGRRISRRYGENKRVIHLGYAFNQLQFSRQVYELIKATAEVACLPELHGMPVGSYRQTASPSNWVDYLFTLLHLLPEKPYLITGTPTGRKPPKPRAVEGEEEPVGSDPVLLQPDTRTVVEGEDLAEEDDAGEEPDSETAGETSLTGPPVFEIRVEEALSETEREEENEEIAAETRLEAPRSILPVSHEIQPQEDEGQAEKGRSLFQQIKDWFSRKK